MIFCRCISTPRAIWRGVAWWPNTLVTILPISRHVNEPALSQGELLWSSKCSVPEAESAATYLEISRLYMSLLYSVSQTSSLITLAIISRASSMSSSSASSLFTFKVARALSRNLATLQYPGADIINMSSTARDNIFIKSARLNRSCSPTKYQIFVRSARISVDSYSVSFCSSSCVPLLSLGAFLWLKNLLKQSLWYLASDECKSLEDPATRTNTISAQSSALTLHCFRILSFIFIG